MSEPILIALVQLFAIVAASKHKQLSEQTRSIIEAYLNQYLSNKELTEYLLLYDELFSFHNISDEKFEWGTPITLEKMRDICFRINKNLQQKDKIIIFIKFVEFIEEIQQESNSDIDDKDNIEFKYYEIIKNAFNLSNTDFNAIIEFLLSKTDLKADSSKLLITKQAKPENDNSNIIIRERLKGQIAIQYLKSVELFIGKYFGTDDLYLNGHFIPKNQSFTITTGSIIKNQKIQPIYYTDIAAKLLYPQKFVKLQFTADNIGFTFKNSSNGIHPFSFEAESGELIGVIGGSGAGKSTLLSILNGTLKPNQGEILINGHNINSEKSDLKRIIGYIPQDDLLIEELTVFQNLYFNAQLCYGNFSSFQLTRIILKILVDVDLIEIRNLVVGSPLNKVISGGQRKRLNIALELLREPFVLFADEPTSGLSSSDSEMVMLLLKEQTLKGRILMVNIHQPSTNIFKLFDKLLFLDKGGFPIYYGNPIEALTYFKTASKHVNPTESECFNCGYVNPEQLFQITESKTINKHGKVTNQRISTPNDWYNAFKKNIQPLLTINNKQSKLPENNFNTPNKFNQFKIFILRNLLVKLTNKQYVLLNLLEAPILAFILAYLTRYSSDVTYSFGQNKNIIAYMFMSVVVALFLGMMVSAEEIIKDRKILKREAFLRLSRISYLNSKIVFLISLSAIQSFLYVLAGNLILGITDTLFTYWLVLFSTSCFANLVGLNISSGLNSVVNIYILIPFFLVPQILLSGVIVPFDTLNQTFSSKKEVPFVGDLMASRWAFEALAVNQFINNDYTKNFYVYDKLISNNSFNYGYLIPALQSEIDACNRKIELNQESKKTKKRLLVVQKEIQELETIAGFKPAEIISKLNLNELNEETRLKHKHYLDSLSNFFASQYKLHSAHRDSVFKILEKNITNEGILELKHKHFNKSLSDWVLNKRGEKKLVISSNSFIRKKDPIYIEPTSKLGRAHFYAPVKFIGKIKINTVIFNIMAIWLMSLGLYFTLWHNSLRKLISYFECLNFKRKN